MGTGHHGALSAGVAPGSTAVVVGDGAVGLCAVLAARRLGAERIISLGHHPDRLDIARRFGATDVVTERGDEAIERVRELTGGGAAHVLECVGTAASFATAIGSARPGGVVGHVGVPAEPVDLLRRAPAQRAPDRRGRPGARLHPGAPGRHPGGDGSTPPPSSTW